MKTLVITGASGGIGRATSILAARSNYSIVVHYNSNAQSAHSLVSEIESLGQKAMSIQADLTNEKEVFSLFNTAQEHLGPISGLVNNAGIIAPISRLDEMDASRLRNIFDSNVVSGFLCAKEAIKRMSSLYGYSGGSIVNVSSAASRLGSPNEFIDYAASKGAIDSMTIGLAKEVAEEGIRVNAVRPGLIETDIHQHTGDANRAKRLKEFVPIKRVGTPEEVAQSIIWLLSDEASYVTGSLLDVSGGR